MQTALIDGARNLLGLQGANSEEFDPAAKDKGKTNFIIYGKLVISNDLCC